MIKTIVFSTNFLWTPSKVCPIPILCWNCYCHWLTFLYSDIVPKDFTLLSMVEVKTESWVNVQNKHLVYEYAVNIFKLFSNITIATLKKTDSHELKNFKANYHWVTLNNRKKMRLMKNNDCRYVFRGTSLIFLESMFQYDIEQSKTYIFQIFHYFIDKWWC